MSAKAEQFIAEFERDLVAASGLVLGGTLRVAAIRLVDGEGPDEGVRLAVRLAAPDGSSIELVGSDVYYATYDEPDEIVERLGAHLGGTEAEIRRRLRLAEIVE